MTVLALEHTQIHATLIGPVCQSDALDVRADGFVCSLLLLMLLDLAHSRDILIACLLLSIAVMRVACWQTLLHFRASIGEIHMRHLNAESLLMLDRFIALAEDVHSVD